jgi:hypothetical protein
MNQIPNLLGLDICILQQSLCTCIDRYHCIEYTGLGIGIELDENPAFAHCGTFA